jgi:Ca2+-transporting ATPase
MVFVGLVGMIDPARPEVGPALAKATKAGIRTIMITGDFANTARAVLWRRR